jgi:hypothetical protein
MYSSLHLVSFFFYFWTFAAGTIPLSLLLGLPLFLGGFGGTDEGGTERRLLTIAPTPNPPAQPVDDDFSSPCMSRGTTDVPVGVDGT